MNRQVFPLGNDLKFLVRLTELGEDVHLDHAAYELKFTSGTKSKAFNISLNPDGSCVYPAGVTRHDEDSVRVAIPTAEMDRGDLWLRATVQIPDADFQDGNRTEIVVHDMGITLE